MMRILTASFLFFLAQVGALLAYAPDILDSWAGLPVDRLPLDDDQRLVLSNIQRLRGGLDRDTPTIILLGGSTGLDVNPGIAAARDDGARYLNLSNSKQSLVDSLRILDNVSTARCHVVLTMHPLKWIIASREDLRLGKLLMGSACKYPIYSKIVDHYYQQQFKNTSCSVLELSPSLNALLYFSSAMAMRFVEKTFTDLAMPFATPCGTEGTPHALEVEDGAGRMVPPGEVEAHLRRMRDYFNAVGAATLEKNVRFALETLTVIADLCAARGWGLTLLETPYSEAYARHLGPEIAVVDGALEVFLREHPGIGFARPPRELSRGRPGLFRDMCHLTPAGKDAFRDYEHRFLTTLAIP